MPYYTVAGDSLDDGQAHSPLGVFRQLDDCRQKRLRQLLDANYFIDAIQIADDVQAHLGTLVLELREEQR